MNEGSAVWIFKVAFPEDRAVGEIKAGWAEATYGTVNYYRDIGLVGYDKNIALAAPSKPSAKLIEVYNWMSSQDLSKLPWNSTAKLQSCYDKYYKNINRNVDFSAWLNLAVSASDSMTQDIYCRPD